jgi:hypothetical protein
MDELSQKMDWVTFWATFSQTHLVTLTVYRRLIRTSQFKDFGLSRVLAILKYFIQIYTAIMKVNLRL